MGEVSKIRRTKRVGFLTLGRPPSLSGGGTCDAKDSDCSDTRSMFYDPSLHSWWCDPDRISRISMARPAGFLDGLAVLPWHTKPPNPAEPSQTQPTFNHDEWSSYCDYPTHRRLSAYWVSRWTGIMPGGAWMHFSPEPYSFDGGIPGWWWYTMPDSPVFAGIMNLVMAVPICCLWWLWNIAVIVLICVLTPIEVCFAAVVWVFWRLGQ
eukprot:COSAG02_NODE_7510_length_2978_cov_2.202154_1_plen_208_part_00